MSIDVQFNAQNELFFISFYFWCDGWVFRTHNIIIIIIIIRHADGFHVLAIDDWLNSVWFWAFCLTFHTHAIWTRQQNSAHCECAALNCWHLNKFCRNANSFVQPFSTHCQHCQHFPIVGDAVVHKCRIFRHDCNRSDQQMDVAVVQASDGTSHAIPTMMMSVNWASQLPLQLKSAAATKFKSCFCFI